MNHQVAYTILCERIALVQSAPRDWVCMLNGERTSENIKGSDEKEYMLDMWIESVSNSAETTTICLSVISLRDQQLDRLEERLTIMC